MAPNVIRRWRVDEKLQVLSSPWLILNGLQFECARVLHDGLLVPFFSMAVKQR